MSAAISQSAMLADLSASFPALEKRFCWLGGCAEGPYDGYIHTGFVAWLEARGWSWECYDIGTMFLVPESYFAEAAA